MVSCLNSDLRWRSRALPSTGSCKRSRRLNSPTCWRGRACDTRWWSSPPAIRVSFRRRRSREPPQRSWFAAWRSGLATVRLAFRRRRSMLTRDPINPDTLNKARFQIELEALAYDPSKKTAHRMRLPVGGFCQRSNGRATRGAQHIDCSRLLRAGSDAATRLLFLPALLGFGRLLDGAAERAAVLFFAVFVIGTSFSSVAALP